MWRVGAVAGVLLLVGVGVVAAAIGGAPLWGLGGVHLLTVAGVVALARQETEPRRARALWLLAMAHGALGPFGTAGTLLSVGLGRYYDRRATPVDEWRRTLFPDAEEDPDAKLWALVDLRNTDRPSAIAPFVDVIEHGALAQKQAVVALIAKHFRPAFAPALRRALHDPQNAVRVQAATAVSLIEAQATSTALDLDRQRRESPDDPQVLLQLARHEDAYAFTGLLDPGRERESRGRAVDAYRAYVLLRPDDVSALHELGRLYVRLARYGEALECFEQVMEHEDSATARLWIMECLFHLRRFGELRHRAREGAVRVSGDPAALPIETQQVLKLWAPGAAPAP
jgi:tetratricopeptide (TPR) repeat protein